VALLKSLNKLRTVRLAITALRKRWLKLRHGITIPASTSISLSARFVQPCPDAIEIGEDSLIAFKTLLMADRAADGTVRKVRIGDRCFVGGGAIILPGVTIGNESIVAAGAVVKSDVPERSIVGGNPAKVIRSGIEVGRFGRLKGADERTRTEWKP
jgi:acetyltransferase-like isoleucine patch superfamily enzyme